MSLHHVCAPAGGVKKALLMVHTLRLACEQDTSRPHQALARDVPLLPVQLMPVQLVPVLMLPAQAYSAQLARALAHPARTPDHTGQLRRAFPPTPQQAPPLGVHREYPGIPLGSPLLTLPSAVRTAYPGTPLSAPLWALPSTETGECLAGSSLCVPLGLTVLKWWMAQGP